VNEHLSLRAAAALLGWRGQPRARAQRLLRYLLAVEAREGRTILVRAGGRGGGRRYLVTLSALRDSAPELLPRRDEVVELVRDELTGITERLEDVSDRGDLIADQLVDLTRRVSNVVDRVVALERGHARSREVTRSAEG